MHRQGGMHDVDHPDELEMEDEEDSQLGAEDEGQSEHGDNDEGHDFTREVGGDVEMAATK